MADTEDSPAIRALSAGQQRVETALIALTELVTAKFDQMGLRFVPREELTQRFTGITEHQQRQDERLMSLEAGREIDRTSHEAQSERIEERQRVDRQNSRIIALALLSVLVATLTIVIAHWR